MSQQQLPIHYREVDGYWEATAEWCDDNGPDGQHGTHELMASGDTYEQARQRIHRMLAHIAEFVTLVDVKG